MPCWTQPNCFCTFGSFCSHCWSRCADQFWVAAVFRVPASSCEGSCPVYCCHTVPMLLLKVWNACWFIPAPSQGIAAIDCGCVCAATCENHAHCCCWVCWARPCWVAH